MVRVTTHASHGLKVYRVWYNSVLLAEFTSSVQAAVKASRLVYKLFKVVK